MNAISMAVSTAVLAAFTIVLCGPCGAAAEDKSLAAMAAEKFPNLSGAELRLLDYADINNQHRGEWAVGGIAADPKDTSNDPTKSNSWSDDRNVRAALIRWMLVDRAATARVDPNGIRLIGARIVGTLDLSHVHVQTDIALVRCRLGKVNFEEAELQAFDLAGSSVTDIHGDGVVAHHSMSLGWDGEDRGGAFRASGKIDLPDARFDDELVFGSSQVHYSDDETDAWDRSFRIAINLANSEIKGDLILCCGFESLGQVSLENATIDSALKALGARFINPDKIAINAQGLRAFNVYVSPYLMEPNRVTQIDGLLDFTGAQVQNNFVVANTIFKGRAGEQHGFIGLGLTVRLVFVWTGITLENGAVLDLSGAHVQDFLDDEASWPSQGNLRIGALKYELLDGRGPHDAKSRLRWLGLQPTPIPQTYLQLAGVLKSQGDETGAADVMAALDRLERRPASRGLFSRSQEFLRRGELTLVALALLSVLVAGAYVRGRRGALDSHAPSYTPNIGFELPEPPVRRSRATGPFSPNERSLGALEAAIAETDSESRAAARFILEGDFWTVSYQASTIRLKDIKGLGYIAFLLAHPGERIHVHELIARVDGVSGAIATTPAATSPAEPTTIDLGHAGEALDARAQADYRRRLRELSEDLAEAERFSDIGRAESIRHEQEFLRGELSAAVGIGGRSRKAAAYIDRARDKVSKNIRAGLEKIRNEDPALGRHFAASVKTGYFCAYLPDPDHKIAWQL